MIALIGALLVVLGPGAVHAGPGGTAQLRACEGDVAAYVQAGGNLARHTSAGIRHDCGPRSELSRRQVRAVRWFAVRQVTLNDS